MRPSALVAGLAALVAGLGLSLGAAGLASAQEQPPARPASPPAPAAAPSPGAPTVPLMPPSALSPEIVAPGPPVQADAAPRPAAPKTPDAPTPPPEPLKRPRFSAAILQGVDKITAETLRFEAKVGEPVRYKGLILTVRACETTAADENINDSIAYVEVQSQPEVLAGRAVAPPRQIYKGWMFASSPTLHPVEHPIYDLWLIACKTAAPGG